MLVAVILVLIASSMAQDASCPVFTAQVNGGQSYTYDISGLKVPNNDKSQFIQGKEIGSGSTWIAYLNICGDASSAGCQQSTPVCQVDGNNGFSMGAPNWQFGIYYEPTKGPNSTPLPDKGIVVTATGGTPCGPPVNAPRKSILFFECFSLANPPTTASIQESDPSDPTSTPTPCVYYWQGMQYSGFCPGAGGGSNGFDYGWVFVIILLCGLFLYFVVGMIVLKFAMHKEGREIVPQVDFWTSLPGLVLDGMKYAFCCVPCRGGGGYSEV